MFDFGFSFNVHFWLFSYPELANKPNKLVMGPGLIFLPGLGQFFVARVGSAINGLENIP